MSIDFEALCLAPIYSVLSYTATFKSPLDKTLKTINVLDETASFEAGDTAIVATIRTAIAVLASELSAISLSPEDMLNVRVTFKSQSYVVKDVQERPVPNGAGDCLLILEEIGHGAT
jgi:hypothetical protein